MVRVESMEDEYEEDLMKAGVKLGEPFCWQNLALLGCSLNTKLQNTKHGTAKYKVENCKHKA